MNTQTENISLIKTFSCFIEELCSISENNEIIQKTRSFLSDNFASIDNIRFLEIGDNSNSAFYNYCISSGSFVYIKSPDSQNILLREYIDKYKILSAVAVPVSSGGNGYGILSIENHHEPGAFAPYDTDCFCLAGTLLGMMFDRVDYSATHRHLGQINRLAEISSEIVFRNIKDIIYSIDKNFTIINISQSLTNELGYSPEEISGRVLSDLKILTPTSLKQAYRKTKELFSTGFGETGTYECIASNGEVRIFEISGSLTHIDGAPIIICVARNVTERYRMEEELEGYYKEILDLNDKLNDSQKQLREILDRKDKFFSIISHDLRSPFNSLLGFSDYLMSDLEELAPAEIKQFAEQINISARYLYKLVDNLLQWSLIETGKLEYYPERLNLRKLFEDNLFLLKGNLMRKNILVETDIDESIFIFADYNTANSVIQNLLSNAIKYSYVKGKILASAEIREGSAEVILKDFGVGMDRETLNKLFRIDIRQSSKGTLREGGTGIGLILCKELIERNNGSIRVESSPGKGSSFIFTLPLSGS